MTDFTPEQKNEVLDSIILSRRTVRNFGHAVPAEDLVMQVITAGLHAPYAKAAVERFKDGYFRRFFVIRAGSDAMAKASELVTERVKELAAELEEKGKAEPAYAEKSRSWSKRLKWFLDLGHVPGVTNAPYFIVIAEHRGIPDLGEHALAHCLENMWLKATALGLAFQIISVVSKMGDSVQFCRLLNLEPHEWDLMGCALGYAEKPLKPSQRPAADSVTFWL